MTFFEWPRAEPGRLGPRDARVDRARDARASTEETEVEDPDGLRLRLYPGEAPRAARRGRDRQSRPLRRPLRRRRAAPVRRAGRGGGADRRRARRTTSPGAPPDDDGAGGLARAADRARPAADAGAGPEVLPLGLLPDAGRDPDRDRDRRPRASSSTSRASRSARRSRCRRGSSPSARRSSASSRRSSVSARLHCARSHALVAELVDALG